MKCVNTLLCKIDDKNATYFGANELLPCYIQLIT